MTPKTAKALELSIEHWKRNVEAAEKENLEQIEIGWIHCALCQLHAHTFSEWACDGCPIKERTGLTGCVKTPYAQVCDALNKGNYNQVLKACRDELAFLESLRDDA